MAADQAPPPENPRRVPVIYKFWVVADRVHTITLTLTMRTAEGIPLPDKTVTVATTRGIVRQPERPKDVSGVTTAVISATTPGDLVQVAVGGYRDLANRSEANWSRRHLPFSFIM